MLVMVVLVLTINILLAKPPIDSLLFALARRLNAIENFGSMDVLCTDKTGTLTEGGVCLDGALDPDGQPSTTVLDYTYLNSQYQTGINNPLDDAIGAYAKQAGLNANAEQKNRRNPL